MIEVAINKKFIVENLEKKIIEFGGSHLSASVQAKWGISSICLKILFYKKKVMGDLGESFFKFFYYEN